MEVQHGLDADGFRAHARNSHIAGLGRFDRKRMLSIAKGPILGYCADLLEDEVTPEKPESLALLLKQTQTRFVIFPENFMSNTQSLHCRHQVTVASPFVAPPFPPLNVTADLPYHVRHSSSAPRQDALAPPNRPPHPSSCPLRRLRPPSRTPGCETGSPALRPPPHR